tara:strand:- start:1663 stop:2493 length:831 start_codon:yes stop_codon:yes gene_type:complete
MNLTIVIVSFNSGDILHRCIKSIDKKYPIIIVENSLNNKLKFELEKIYPNVNCILPKENLGYGAGNNLGIKQAKSKYVLILNPDTILYEDTISNLLIQAEIIKDFSIIGPRIVENENEKTELLKKDNESVQYIKGFAILFNKEKFDKIGLFDENYFLYFEEIDLCKRITNSGNKIYLVKNSLIKHVGGKSHEDKFNVEMELSRNWHWMWSTFYYYKKNYNYLYAVKKVYKNFLSSLFKFLFYSLVFNKEKKMIYYQRMSGIFNGIIGKKSWYRPKV